MNSPCPHELVQEMREFPGRCDFCEEKLTGPRCQCLQCFKHLHKTCLQPLNQIQHPFHPQHPLFLKTSNTKTSCNACKNDHKTPTYNCSLCSFCLHFKCSKLTPTMKTSHGGGGEVLQPDHLHTLLLCSKGDQFKYYSCDYCGRALDDLIYVCLECNVSLHKICAQCPLEVHHPLHPRHPLRLTRYFGSVFICFFCNYFIHGEFAYRCEECDYTLDASCSCFMPIDIRDKTWGHVGGNLTLLQTNNIYPLIVPRGHNSIKSCGACEQVIKDANDLIYFCSNCQLFFHKSCIELSREIKTPIDPFHLLTLEDECTEGPFYEGRKQKICALCGVLCVMGFVYRCSNCDITMHLKCFLLLRLVTTLMSINHHHPLVLYDRPSSSDPYDPIKCSKCKKNHSFPFFSCFSCKLHLHAHCLPKLPATIKSTYHRHSLTLTYSPVKDWPDEPDDADFYCDNCEEKRNIHEATYFCEQCHFVAHLGCVTTQIKDGLEEEWSASKSGALKYETYDDVFEKLLRSVDQELKSLQYSEGCLEEILDQVSRRMDQLKEALVEKDKWTMSRLVRGGSSMSEKQLRAKVDDILDKEWKEIKGIEYGSSESGDDISGMLHAESLFHRLSRRSRYT